MDCKKNCRTMAMFLILGILAAADTENIGDTDTRKSMERLQANTVAYSDYHVRRNEPLHYTLLQPANNDITMKDLLNLQGKLYGEKPMNEIMTMITIEKRDREIIDSKDTDMVNFISAMQQYIANENVRSINVGNLTVIFNLVEEEYMTGYKMIKSIQEEAILSGIYLHTLIIDNLCNIYFAAYEQWLVDQIYKDVTDNVFRFANESKETTDQLIEGYFNNNYYSKLMLKLKNCSQETSVNDLSPTDKHYTHEITKLEEAVIKNEESMDFKNFTESFDCLHRDIDFLLWRVYTAPYKIDNKVADLSLKIMQNSENKQKLKEAFSRGCKILLQRFKNKNLKNKADAGNDDEACKNRFNAVYEKFFEDIGFKSIQEDFAKIECSELDTLHKRIVKQPGTRICINEKISIDMFYDFLRILDVENVFENLFESKSLIIDRGKLMVDHDKKPNGSDGEYAMRSINGIEYKLNVCEGLECISKTIEPNQKWSFETDLVGDRSIEISVTEMHEADFDIPLGVQMLESKCLEENKSKLTGRCKIAVKNKDFLTDVYILDHRKEHGEDKNLTSVIFDNQTHNHSETCFAADKTTRDIICLDNVPLPYLDTLIDSLQLSQITRPTQFAVPNIQKHKNSHIFTAENYVTFETFSSMEHELTTIFQNIVRSQLELNFSTQISLTQMLDWKNSITPFVKACSETIKSAGFEQDELEQNISKPLANFNFFEDDLNDPFIITASAKDYMFECHSASMQKAETIMHFCVLTKNRHMILPTNMPIQVIKKMLNCNQRKLVLGSLTIIAENMKLGKDLVPIVFAEIFKGKWGRFFDKYSISVHENPFHAENSLSKIGHLFGYTRKWIKENVSYTGFCHCVCDDSDEDKKLIVQAIRNLLDIVMHDDSHKGHYCCLKIVSAMKIAKVTQENDNDLLDPKTKTSIAYTNLKRFKRVMMDSTEEDTNKENN